jgi:hypothetical protein
LEKKKIKGMDKKKIKGMDKKKVLKKEDVKNVALLLIELK